MDTVREDSKRTMDRRFLWPVVVAPDTLVSQHEARDSLSAVQAEPSDRNRAEASKSADPRREASRAPLSSEIRTI